MLGHGPQLFAIFAPGYERDRISRQVIPLRALASAPYWHKPTPWPKPAPSKVNTPLRYWLFSIQPEKSLLPSAAKWLRRRSGDNSTTAPFTSWSCIFIARPHGLLRIGLIDRTVSNPTRSPRDFPETSVVQRYLPLFSQGHGRPCPDNGATAFESAAKVSDARAGRPPQHEE